MAKAATHDSVQKTLLVTVLLSLVCSIVVSSAAVFLQPKQALNQVADIQRNILAISGLAPDAQRLSSQQVADRFKQVTPRLVDLTTGRFIDATAATIKAYDQHAAAKNPKTSRALPASQDIAAIKRQATVAKVYVVEQAGAIKTLVLPLHGYGLWSTLYGFIALASDFNTVVGFGFYEHGETPGLGGEVDNPLWQQQWAGKAVYDLKSDAPKQVALKVIKGTVDANSAQARYQVDGLAGATLTSNGVSNLVRFWLGKHGFGPFLQRLQQQGNG